MPSQPVCMINELPVSGSLELELNGEPYFVVRQGSQVYLYRNKCPHIGLPLNLIAHQFLDYDKRYIQCTNHGALFEISTGHCIAGPCKNKSLEMLPCHIENGAVFLTEY